MKLLYEIRNKQEVITLKTRTLDTGNTNTARKVDNIKKKLVWTYAKPGLQQGSPSTSNLDHPHISLAIM
jgi:hypothetical protein